jgi:hypothetical protein
MNWQSITGRVATSLIFMAFTTSLISIPIFRVHSQQIVNIPPDLKYSFVIVTVESPILDTKSSTACPRTPHKCETGSGVLVTAQGHILTVGHVVESAIDEGTEFNLYRVRNARVSIQFIDDKDRPQSKLYDADVLYYTKHPDVAVLQIDLDNDVPRYLPTVDLDLAHVNCVYCYTILGYTDQTFEAQPASPSQRVRNDFKRLVTSNMAPGFSGGPVFHISPKEWSLVGIGVSGLRTRQTSNFIVAINAFAPVFKSIRDHVVFRERVHFPSPRLIDLFGKTLTGTEDITILQNFIDRMMTRKPEELITVLLDEDFFSISEDTALTNLAKRLLEMTMTSALNISMKSPVNKFDSTSISLLIDRLVTLYDWSDPPEVQRATERLREGILLNLKQCKDIVKSTKLVDGQDRTSLSRCWQRMDVKYSALTSGRIRKGYQTDLSALNNKKKAPNFVFWWRSISNHLLDWGDFLSQIGTFSNKEIVKIASQTFSPTYLNESLDPTQKRPDYPSSHFTAAAVDKYLESLPLLSIPERYPAVKAQLSSEVGHLRIRACKSARDHIARLKGFFSQGDPFYLLLEDRVVNNVNPICS